MNNSNDQIIQLLGSGYTVKEVANITGMKRYSVERRIRNMKKMRGCKTVTQLVVNWLKLSNESIIPV
jgi:DNA-binding CsgD family transcriptional regulator